MFGPDWEAGCPTARSWADNFNGIIVHLNQRDVTLVTISRAPYAKLAAYEKRMGWTFKWLSSLETDFNFDFHVSFTPEEIAAKDALYNYRTAKSGSQRARGISVFFKDHAGVVFHTYSSFARGIDMSGAAPIIFSTWCRRAAMKAAADRSGCDGTTSMKARRNPIAAGENLKRGHRCQWRSLRFTPPFWL